MDFFGLIAPFYDRFHGQERTHRLVQRILERAAPLPQGRVLDLGGGTGRVAVGFQPRVAQTVVLDSSRGMLLQATKKPGLHVVQASAAFVPFPDASFHTILCVDAFHHFLNQEEVLKEVARVLAPSGRLFIHDFDAGKLVVRLIATMERLCGNRGAFRRPEELQRLCQLQGLVPLWEAKESVEYFLLLEKPARATPSST